MSLAYKIIESPVGKLKASRKRQRAWWPYFGKTTVPRRVRLSELVEDERHPVLVETERQLGEYFAGKRKTFSITLDMRGTSFQKNVWEALLAIPFGETRSLWTTCETTRESSGDASCRRSERKKSSINHRALPSSHWFVRETYRLRGWTRCQSPFAQPGGEEPKAFRVATSAALQLGDSFAR